MSSSSSVGGPTQIINLVGQAESTTSRENPSHVRDAAAAIATSYEQQAHAEMMAVRTFPTLPQHVREDAKIEYICNLIH